MVGRTDGSASSNSSDKSVKRAQFPDGIMLELRWDSGLVAMELLVLPITQIREGLWYSLKRFCLSRHEVMECIRRCHTQLLMVLLSIE